MSICANTRRTSSTSSTESWMSGSHRRNRATETVRICSVITHPSHWATGTRCIQPRRSTLVKGKTLTSWPRVRSRWNRDDTTSAGRSLPCSRPRTGSRSTNHTCPGSTGGRDAAELTCCWVPTRRQSARRRPRIRQRRRGTPTNPADRIRGIGVLPRRPLPANARRRAGGSSRQRTRRRTLRGRYARPSVGSGRSLAARQRVYTEVNRAFYRTERLDDEARAVGQSRSAIIRQAVHDLDHVFM